MKLRLLAAVVGLMAGTAAVHAQVGIYIAPTGSHISVSQPDSGPFSFLTPNASSEWFKGATVGAYYDFDKLGPGRLGLDARWRILGSPEQARANSFLVGPRLTFNTP